MLPAHNTAKAHESNEDSSHFFSIRSAQADDAPCIRRIGSAVFAATFGHSLPSADLAAYLAEAYSQQSILDDIASTCKTVCVAHDVDDTVLGFATLTEGTMEECIRSVPAPVELQRLYVDSGAHRRGVGGKLVRHVEQIAREKGFRTCWLGVWEENYKAQRFYQRLGYAKVGAHDFVMGNEVQTDWIMMREL